MTEKSYQPEKRTIQAQNFSLEFEIDGDLSEPLNLRRIKLGYGFLDSPFTGRLKMYFDEEDVLSQLPRQRNLYPIRCLNWLAENFPHYIKEGKPEMPNERWMGRHIVGYYLGDYSPQIALYRTEEAGQAVETPDLMILLPQQTFARGIIKASEEEIELLKTIPSLGENNIIRSLRRKLARNRRITEHL